MCDGSMIPRPPGRVGNAIRSRRVSLKALWPEIAGRSLCLMASSRGSSRPSILNWSCSSEVCPFAHKPMCECGIRSLRLCPGDLGKVLKHSSHITVHVRIQIPLLPILVLTIASSPGPSQRGEKGLVHMTAYAPFCPFSPRWEGPGDYRLSLGYKSTHQ